MDNIYNINLPNRISIYEASIFDDYIINTIFNMSKTASINSNTITTTENSIPTTTTENPTNLFYYFLSKFNSFYLNNFDKIKTFFHIFYHIRCILLKIPTEGEKIFNIEKITLNNSIINNVNFGKIKSIIFILVKYTVKYWINNFNTSNSDTDLDSENIENPNTTTNTTTNKYIYNLIHTLYTALDLLNFILFINKGDYPSLFHRIFTIKYSVLFERAGSMSYNYLMKQIIFNKLVSLILYMVKDSKNNIKKFMGRFLDKNSDSNMFNSNNTIMCYECKNNTPFDYVRFECCSRGYCYYCRIKLLADNNTSSNSNDDVIEPGTISINKKCPNCSLF